MEPLDLALAANGISEAVQAVADDAVDALNPRRGKNFGKLIGDSFHHLSPGFVRAARRLRAQPRCRWQENVPSNSLLLRSAG
jgi:hypothetical protein